MIYDTSNVYVLVMFALGHTAPGHAALAPFFLILGSYVQLFSCFWGVFWGFHKWTICALKKLGHIAPLAKTVGGLLLA